MTPNTGAEDACRFTMSHVYLKMLSKRLRSARLRDRLHLRCSALLQRIFVVMPDTQPESYVMCNDSRVRGRRYPLLYIHEVNKVWKTSY